MVALCRVIQVPSFCPRFVPGRSQCSAGAPGCACASRRQKCARPAASWRMSVRPACSTWNMVCTQKPDPRQAAALWNGNWWNEIGIGMRLAPDRKKQVLVVMSLQRFEGRVVSLSSRWFTSGHCRLQKSLFLLVLHMDWLGFFCFISGLPIQVRDAGLSLKDEMPKSDVNKEYYTQNMEREVSVSAMIMLFVWLCGEERGAMT